jgi:hypothetical protein
MSTSYSSKASAKLLRLLTKLVSLLEPSSSSLRRRKRRKREESRQQHESTASNDELLNNFFKNSIHFDSMCSMCFLDHNSLRTCSRCTNRLISSISLSSSSLDKCSFRCLAKISMFSKVLSTSSRFFISIFSNWRDFHVANFCIFVFFATIVLLYKTSELNSEY